MSEKKVKVIDCEPKWIDIVRIWKELDKKCSDVYIYSELQKMATLMDIVRQADKDNTPLLFCNGQMYKPENSEEVRKLVKEIETKHEAKKGKKNSR